MSAFGRNRQLSDLRADVVFLADLPPPTSATYITTQNLTDLVNAGIAELFGIVLRAAGEANYLKTTTITTDGVNFSYPLPADFFRLVRCEYITNNSNTRIPLRRFGPQERPYLLSADANWTGEAWGYNLVGKTAIGQTVGESIELLPIASSGRNVEVAYVFCPPRLVGDTDTLDGWAGFEDYATLYAAHRCAIRGGPSQEDRASQLAQERERIRGNVESMMSHRDALNPPKVRLVRDNPEWNARRWVGRNWRP